MGGIAKLIKVFDSQISKLNEIVNFFVWFNQLIVRLLYKFVSFFNNL